LNENRPRPLSDAQERQAYQQKFNKFLEHWIEGFGRREEEVPDLSEFLSRWWKQGDQGRVRVASTLVRYWGARKDLSYLEGIVATYPDGKLPNFSDIVYDVQRRTAA